MLEINSTLIFQMIGFFALLFVMNRFLYKPILAILKDRDEKIAGSLKKAAETDKEVEDGLAAYAKRLKDATVSGNETRGKIRQEGVDREKTMLEAAREKASSELNRMKSEIERSKAGALSSLREESKAISRNIAEKMLDRKVLSFILAVGLMLLPALGMAAEEHGGHGGEGHGPFNIEFLWKTINFVILAVIIYVVWVKVIAKLLDKRSADIKKAIEDARAAKEAADRKGAEYREKLSMLEKRVSELHRELELEGEAEKARIISEAEKASAKIMEQARLTAEQELKKAKTEIRKEAADLAVKMAGEILKKDLNPDDQKRLVKGYIDNLRLN